MPLTRRRRAARWLAGSSLTDVIRDRFVPLQIAPHDASELAGSVHSRLVGHLQAAVVVSAPQTFTRTRRLASASGVELWALGLVEAGTGHLEQDGRACTVTGGDFALYDTSRPFNVLLAGLDDDRRGKGGSGSAADDGMRPGGQRVHERDPAMPHR